MAESKVINICSRRIYREWCGLEGKLQTWYMGDTKQMSLQSNVWIPLLFSGSSGDDEGSDHRDVSDSEKDYFAVCILVNVYFKEFSNNIHV